MELTHFNEAGRAHMVDVSHKETTTRVAIARGEIRMKQATLEAIKEGKMSKGDVLSVAQVAGIMGAKKTSELIPMCHPLFLTNVNIEFDFITTGVAIQATAKTTGQTGVEMEALTAVTTAALTIYDMCKAIDKEMLITNICLNEKEGGKSGHYKRSEHVEG